MTIEAATLLACLLLGVAFVFVIICVWYAIDMIAAEEQKNRRKGGLVNIVHKNITGKPVFNPKTVQFRR